MNKDKEMKELTTQEKQVYSAKCLDNYCRHFGIFDDSIDFLLDHLYAMPAYDDLSRWDSIGSKVELTRVALGDDPLSESLTKRIPEEKIPEFKSLLMNVVEVGMSDMYSADSDWPFTHLCECIKILEKYKIGLPNYPKLYKKITGMAY
jgi:hypothetical protein